MSYIKPNSVVKRASDGGYRIQTPGEREIGTGVPSDQSELVAVSAYDECVIYEADGNPVLDEYTPAEILSDTRQSKISDIKEEAVRRIALQVDVLDDFDSINLMAFLWPMLDTSSASAELLMAKDIYQYAKTKVTQVKGATQAQLDAYDAPTDPGWPA